VFRYGKESTNPNMFLGGVNLDFLPCNDYTVKEGRYFTQLEINSAEPVTVLGMEVVDKLFPKETPLGKKIILDFHEYTIIGVLEAKGESFGQSRDNLALVPITRTQQIYRGDRDRNINIAVQAPSRELYDETVEHVTGIMRVIRKVGPGEENNFEIYSNESLISQVNNFTKYFKYGAGFISFIALLAAGVGIMNIMLVSVTERTREIGMLGAMGMRPTQISLLFILEGVMIGLVGVAAGIVLGLAINGLLMKVGLDFSAYSTITSYMALIKNKIYPTWGTEKLVMRASVVAIISALAALIPAIEAGRREPAEALHYV